MYEVQSNWFGAADYTGLTGQKSELNLFDQFVVPYLLLTGRGYQDGLRAARLL